MAPLPGALPVFVSTQALGIMVISGAVSRWYFTMDKKSGLPTFPCLGSCRRTCRCVVSEWCFCYAKGAGLKQGTVFAVLWRGGGGCPGTRLRPVPCLMRGWVGCGSWADRYCTVARLSCACHALVVRCGAAWCRVVQSGAVQCGSRRIGCGFR